MGPFPMNQHDEEAGVQTHGPDNVRGSVDAIDAALRFLAIVRRRWLAVGATVLLVAAVGLAVVSNLRPYWRARVSVVVNTDAPTRVLDSVSGVNDQDLWSPVAQQEYAGTQQEIIKSRSVATAALERLDIADDPVFLGVDGVENDERRAELAAQADPVEILRSMITTGRVRDSKVLWIAVEYPDPEVARDIVNAVADAFLEIGDTSRSETGEDAKSKIAEERAKARERLALAEQALDEFKQGNEITTISLDDRQNLITQNITLLTAKVSEARSKRIELESIYSEAKRIQTRERIASVSLLEPSERMTYESLLGEKYKAEQELAQAQIKYLADHPQYKRAEGRVAATTARLDEMGQELVASLRARVRAAESTEGRLKAVLKEENEKALQLGRLEPKFRQLERDAETAEETYRVLSRRDAEVEMTNRVESESPISVLDYATLPTAPVRPRKTLLMAATLALGLALGSFVAVALDLRDHRIRSSGDLERLIADYGLRLLGALPELPADPLIGTGNVKAQRRQRDLYTFLHPKSQMSENCRGIRTSLAFSSSSGEAQSLMVTSPGSGDGKSATAINLAMSFCQAQKRVVIVDADMRRPRLHHVFPPPVEQGERGLSAVLEGTAALDEVLQASPDGAPELLSALCCGKIPEHPAELLDSAEWRRVVSELKERFDVVIIDSPPLLPVTDPRIIAPQVDGVVVVVRCGRTTRTALQTALGMLRQSDSNLLGAILNQVDPRMEGRHYGYGYQYKNPYYTYSTKEA